MTLSFLAFTPAWLPELGPLVDTLFRVVVGAALVPYVLRSSFGFFPNTGLPLGTVRSTADYMNRFGWKPGMLWAVVSTLNNLIVGPMLALGMFTRLSALLCGALLFLSACHHLRKDGYFANQNGLEHYALWALCCLYFIVHGGGPYSLDAYFGFPH